MHFFGLFGSDYIVPTSPKGILDVLLNHSYDFEKPSGFRRYVIRFFGNSLVSQEQGAHRSSRKLFIPAFNQAAIREFRPIITSKSQTFVERVMQLCSEEGMGSNADEAHPVIIDISQLAASVSLDVMSSTALGYDFNTIGGENSHVLDAFHHLFSGADKSFHFICHNILPPWLVRLCRLKQDAAMDTARIVIHNAICAPIMNKLREIENKSPNKTSFLAHLAQIKPFQEADFVAQLMITLAAG